MGKNKQKHDPRADGRGRKSTPPGGAPASFSVRSRLDQRGVIPAAPPMADKRDRWPLIAVLAIYAIWLGWLAYLAVHSARWK